MFRLRYSALLFILLASLSARAQSQTVTGDWSGSIDLAGSKLEVTLHLREPEDSTPSGNIDIPSQGITGARLKSLRHAGDSLVGEIASIPGTPTFWGVISSDGSTYSGTFRQAGAELPFMLVKKDSAASLDRATMLDSLRQWYAKAIKDWNVPGMSVAIVRDGEVLLTEGFGYRDLAQKLPVTAQTLFAIGSSTKAFTSEIMATLVDAGQVDWNTPVRTYLPTFELKDPYATDHLTVRDILTHESGLPRHDMMWYGSNLTRQQLFDRLRYLEPTAPIREKWQYQNLMFMTAGLLEQEVTGKPWEELVRERIFEPLGMTSTTTSLDTMKARSDHSLGYAVKESQQKSTTEPEPTLLPYRAIDAMGPAGSINSNAVDMAKWLELNIEGGTFHAKPVIGEGALRTVQTPQVVIGEHTGAPEIVFDLYAMGWMVHSFRGSEVLEHGGNIDGFSAQVAFMPKEKIGVVVLTNRNETGLPGIAAFQTLDRLLGHAEKDWSQWALSRKNLAEAISKSSETEPEKKQEDYARVPNTHPSHPLIDYTGQFVNPAYGMVTISPSKAGRHTTDQILRLQFRTFDEPLEHYHYDVFAVPDTAKELATLKVQFHTDINGEITSLALPLEPATGPILFTRQANDSLSNESYLKQFAGDYDFGSLIATIELHQDSQGKSELQMTVPNQPTYTLIPTQQDEFDPKGLKGYHIRFVRENGVITKFIALQPNGAFPARRVSK